jgi:hypothetical protein
MMTTTKRGPLVYLAGIGGALVTGAVVAVLCLVPLPSLTLTAPSLEITPVPATPTKICPGGLVDVIGRASDATTFQGFAAPAISVMGATAAPTQTPLEAPDNVATDSQLWPQLLTGTKSAGGGTDLIAGAQSQLTVAEVISGLALTGCGEASTDQWLVGGSTEVGRTSLLFLNNPLDVDALVSLEIFGENGQVDAPGMNNLVVAPRSQRIISLASFAPELVEPVVHVTTTGGQVLAAIQQTVTRVLTPSGVEIVSPGATPALTQVIPGIALTGQAGQDSEGGQVTSDLAPAVRVLIPGKSDAEVTVTVIGQTGEPYVIKTKLTAGRTLQLPFLGVPDGIYTAVVTAAVPVVAAARTISSLAWPMAPETPAPAGDAAPAKAAPAPTGLGGDFTWNASSLTLNGTALIPVPAGPHPTLTLYNSGDETQSVAITSSGSAWQTVEVPARASRTLAAPQLSLLAIADAHSIHATVTMRDRGLGSAYPVAPASRLGSQVTVFPR